MSMNPGDTVRPVASMVRAAVFPASRPMAAILPCADPDIADIRRIPGAVDNPSRRESIRSKSCADAIAAICRQQEPEFHRVLSLPEQNAPARLDATASFPRVAPGPLYNRPG